MAKLSDAQINALKFYANGEGSAPRENTRKSLITNRFLTDDNTVTDEGYSAAGIERDTSVDEILAELNTNPWDAVQFADHGDIGLSPEKIEEIFSPLDTVDSDAHEFVSSFGTAPAMWRTSQHWDNNVKAWQGLTADEIKADIATARPLANRRDRRSGNVEPFEHKHF